MHGALRGCAVGALGLTIGNALELSWDERADWVRIAVARGHRGRGVVASRCRCCSCWSSSAASASFTSTCGRAAQADGSANESRPLNTALHMLWTFSQLSVLGFGGGKGIIPQMHRDVVGNLSAGLRTISSRSSTRSESWCPGRRRSSRPSSAMRRCRASRCSGPSIATDRHVRTVERDHGRRRHTVGALLRVAVAADHFARPRARHRRFGVGERLDDQPRYAPAASFPTR